MATPQEQDEVVVEDSTKELTIISSYTVDPPTLFARSGTYDVFFDEGPSQPFMIDLDSSSSEDEMRENTDYVDV